VTSRQEHMEMLSATILAGMIGNPGGPLQHSGMCGTDFINGSRHIVAAWATELAYEVVAEVARVELSKEDIK